MLTLDDFFLLQKPFADTIAAHLPLPATIDLYALAVDGTMHPLHDHLCGERLPVSEDLHALTHPWIAEGQLVFPFPLTSKEMATAVADDIDPTFLRKMSTSWLRETREALLDRFQEIRLGSIDPETELYNRRALTFFLQARQEASSGFFFLINTVFCRRSAARNLQRLKEIADWLLAMRQGQYFSFGYGVFGVYMPLASRKSALKTARNLQHQLRREGMSKVQIGFGQLSHDQDHTGGKGLEQCWRALEVAEKRGPFGLCDIDVIDTRASHPFHLTNTELLRQGRQQWSRLQRFTLALLTFHSHQDALPSWIGAVNDQMAASDWSVLASGEQVLLVVPDDLHEAGVDSIETVIEDARRRFGAGSFLAGVASWPCLDCTKGDVVGNCLKAQRHATFLEPGSVVFFDHLTLNISGDSFFEEGEYQAALREYRRGLRLHPGDVNLLNSLGVTLVECNRLRDAADCFQDALRQEPDNYMALVNLGRVRQTLGLQEGAVECFERAFSTHAGDTHAGQELFLPLAQLYIEFGRHEKAITVLEQWLHRPDSNKEFLLFRLLGQCSLEIGHPSEAMQACQRALRLFPQDNISLSILGVLYVEQGEGSELGVSLCTKALALDRFNPDHWYRLGRAYCHIGHYTEALDACHHCLHLHRTHVDGIVQLGMVHQAMGDVKRAHKYFLKALSVKGCSEALADRIQTLLNEQQKGRPVSDMKLDTV